MYKGQLLSFDLSATFSSTTEVNIEVHSPETNCPLIFTMTLQQSATTLTPAGDPSLSLPTCTLGSSFAFGFDSNQVVWGDVADSCSYTLPALLADLQNHEQFLIKVTSSPDVHIGKFLVTPCLSYDNNMYEI